MIRKYTGIKRHCPVVLVTTSGCLSKFLGVDDQETLIAVSIRIPFACTHQRHTIYLKYLGLVKSDDVSNTTSSRCDTHDGYSILGPSIIYSTFLSYHVRHLPLEGFDFLEGGCGAASVSLSSSSDSISS